MCKFSNIFICVLFISTVKGETQAEDNFEFNDFENYLSEVSYDSRKERNEPKMCRYRSEGLFPDMIWNWKAGGGCYLYFSPEWFTNKIKMVETRLTIGNATYVIFTGRSSGIPLVFDYTNQTYTELIRQSFKTEVLYQKWLRCAVNAYECCAYEMDNQNVYPCKKKTYPCPTVWDAWTCFPSTKRNTISEMPCPDYTSSSNDSPCTLYSQKQCYLSGTWNQQTNYSTCAFAPVFRKRHNFHVIVLYISIGLCFPAILIFISYRKLRILRINLHRNLLIACILRSIFAVMQKEIVVLDSLKPSNETNDVLNENGVWCRILAFFLSVATNSIYACMLVDGIYLHKLIVRIFSPDPNIYILYGATAVISFLPTLIWAILLAVDSDQYCWAVDDSWYQWVPDGFRIAILCINVILMLDIMKALLSKLRKNNSTQHTKSTLKAMLFLIPLFGVPFILTSNRNIVDVNSCTAVDIYYYVSYSIQALQGVMVAVLFCYWNKEVHTQLRRTYEKLKIRFDFNSSFNRRETAATCVPNSVARQTQNKVSLPVENNGAADNTTDLKNNPTSNVRFAENQHDTPVINIDLSKRVSHFIDEDDNENNSVNLKR